MGALLLIVTVLFLGIQDTTATGECAHNRTSKKVTVASVCYPHVGCFDDDVPFNNAAGKLPEPPEVLQVGLRLYTRESANTSDYQMLDYVDVNKTVDSFFNASRPTKFVIHGFWNTGDEPWVMEMKDALLVKDDFNVIVVDWGKGAQPPDYDQCVANLRLVGTEVMLLLAILQGQGLRMSDVHLIGHSLGAHMSGYIGLLTGSRIQRITGMDPADPDFECLPSLVRLDPGDAMFVDVIHTNGAQLTAGGAGLLQPSGHVDFYVNGGKSQPGCKDGLGGIWHNLVNGQSISDGVSCSHARSHAIFTESINTKCTFTAFPCDDYAKFLRGECMDCGARGCSSVGYLADQFYATGALFLTTKPVLPFCGYQYAITVNISSSARETKGSLSLSLHGAYGNTSFVKFTTGDYVTLKSGSTINSMGVFESEVGAIHSVAVKYDKHDGTFGWSFLGGGRKEVKISSVVVESGETGERFTLCDGEYEIKDEEDLELLSTDHGLC